MNSINGKLKLNFEENQIGNGLYIKSPSVADAFSAGLYIGQLIRKDNKVLDWYSISKRIDLDSNTYIDNVYLEFNLNLKNKDNDLFPESFNTEEETVELDTWDIFWDD